MADRPHNDSGVKYAVLINGGNFPPYYFENIALCHHVLLKNGYKEENIHIFDSDLPWFVSLLMEVKKPYPVKGPAKVSEIKKQFQELGRIITPADQLFVYTTDHGQEKQKQCNMDSVKVSTLVLEDESIDEIDFAELFRDIHPKIGLFVFDQCHSGGFANRLAADGRITIAACSARGDSNGNTFPEAFFRSFIKKAGDMNRDGQVSIKEAFEFALQHDRNALEGEQTPVMIYRINCEISL